MSRFAFTAEDRKLLGEMKISEPAPSELNQARQDTAIALGMMDEERRGRQYWKRIAFGWCTVAVLASAGFVCAVIWAVMK